MCCELFLKYFRDYDEIEETYDDENYFDKAVKILYEKERGLATINPNGQEKIFGKKTSGAKEKRTYR